MAFDPEKHHRRSVRLPDYDYAQPGAYFVTVCTHERECLFGEIAEEAMRLNDLGRVVSEVWHAVPAHFSDARTDAFVVMPNHIHGVIVIVGYATADSGVGATHVSPLPVPQRPAGPKPGSLGAIVGSFKSAVTRRINAHRGTPGAKVWQRNYHEHVIRGRRDLDRVRRYIAENPQRWFWDRYRPR